MAAKHLRAAAYRTVRQSHDSRGYFPAQYRTRSRPISSFRHTRVIGNIYYVGSPTLASFLIVTPQGNVLINSCYEDTVPVIPARRWSSWDSDSPIPRSCWAVTLTRITCRATRWSRTYRCASDGHGTGHPRACKITPGNKPHPIDRVLHDGDDVKLGDTTLIAHLTPGHTRGCTTWTVKTSEGGKVYDVVIVGSVA